MKIKLYKVHEKALTYYKNILQLKNIYNKILVNEDILIKRITAMCYAGIKIDCKNKKGLKKIYCNGYKITVDWDNHFVKYIALINVSNDDFCESNKLLLDASMKEDILKRLSDNYVSLGLNSLGLVLEEDSKRDIEYISNKEKIHNYDVNVFNDVKHKCEAEFITDPMVALYLCQSIYKAANKRRELKNKTFDIVPEKRLYITRVLNDGLGNTMVWQKIK